MTRLTQPMAGIINILRDAFFKGVEGFVLYFLSQLMKKAHLKTLTVEITLTI